MHSPPFTGAGMARPPTPKSIKNGAKNALFSTVVFTLFVASLFLIFGPQSIENPCPKRSKFHEKWVLPAVTTEIQEKDIFSTFFGMIFHLFSIDFCDVFDVGFEDFRSIPAKRPYQKHTGKHRVLHQKQHLRKTDIDTNK